MIGFGMCASTRIWVSLCRARSRIRCAGAGARAFRRRGAGPCPRAGSWCRRTPSSCPGAKSGGRLKASSTSSASLQRRNGLASDSVLELLGRDVVRIARDASGEHPERDLLRAGQVREPVRERVVETQAPVVDELQEQRRHERLGDVADPKVIGSRRGHAGPRLAERAAGQAPAVLPDPEQGRAHGVLLDHRTYGPRDLLAARGRRGCRRRTAHGGHDREHSEHTERPSATRHGSMLSPSAPVSSHRWPREVALISCVPKGATCRASRSRTSTKSKTADSRV